MLGTRGFGIWIKDLEKASHLIVYLCIFISLGVSGELIYYIG